MDNGIDRRKFLRLAGAGTAAAALAAWGCAGAPSGPQQDPAEAEEPRFGIAGMGEVSFSASCDVLIVGSGIAGLSAAMSTSEAGAKTIVVDKDTLLGGESYASSGMLRTHGTKLQAKAGVKKSVEEWWAERQELLAARYPDAETPPKTLLEAICNLGPTWVDRMSADYGASFQDPAEYLDAGVDESVIIPKSGLEGLDDVMNPLRDQLAAQGVDFMADQTLEAFVVDGEGVLRGARLLSPDSGASTDVQASAIVLATGSCTTNQKVCADHLPDLLQVGCHGYLADGGAMLAARRLGAATLNLELAPDLIGDVPAVDAWGMFAPVVAVGPDARRFAREDERFSCPNECFAQDLGYWWTIFDQQMSEGVQSSSAAKAVEKFAARHVGPFDTLDELAQACHLRPDALKETLKAYEAAAKAHEDEEFGRTAHLKPLEPPYHAIRQRPLRFRTVGGLRVDEACRVVDGTGSPLQGLYACGSCAAIMSTGFLDNAASGLIAGQSAVDDLAAAEIAARADATQAHRS